MLHNQVGQGIKRKPHTDKQIRTDPPIGGEFDKTRNQILSLKKTGLHESLLHFYLWPDCSCCHNKNSLPMHRVYPE